MNRIFMKNLDIIALAFFLTYRFQERCRKIFLKVPSNILIHVKSCN
jgi:hypothetical protein